jgi:hypothetical protein
MALPGECPLLSPGDLSSYPKVICIWQKNNITWFCTKYLGMKQAEKYIPLENGIVT